MTDVVIIVVVQSVTTVAVILVNAGINARVKKVELLQKMRIAKSDESLEKIDKIAEKQDVIHKQIDGRMEDLIKINKEASEAIGKLKGKEEQKQEQDKKEEEPLPVVVTNVVEVVTKNTEEEKKLDK